MISIHPTPPDFSRPFAYASGFHVVPAVSLAEIEYLITHHVWSPCIWEAGERKKDNFLFSSWMAFDFDDGEMTIEMAKEHFAGFKHIIGTTKSHMKDKGGIVCERFRVVAKCADTDNKVKYEHNLKEIVDDLGADLACVDCGRFFWPCVEIVRVDSGPDFIRLKNPKVSNIIHYNGTAKHLYRVTQAFLRGDVVKGERNSKAFAAACDMLRHKWSNERVFGAIKNVTSLSDNEIKNIVNSAQKRFDEKLSR